MNDSFSGSLRIVIVFLATAWLGLVALEGYAEARAGGGGSGGSRGSRSYQAPARPSQPTRPTEPRRDSTPQQPSPLAPQPGGFMRGLAGGLLGGFLGAMFFSSLAQAGGGGFGGSGISLIEILLLAGVGYWIYRKVRRPALATGYGSMQYQDTNSSSYQREPVVEAPAVAELDFNSIRIMDPRFDPAGFVKSAQDIFFKIQAAWSRQDKTTLASLLAPELARSWEQEFAGLAARGQKNYIENIALRTTEITEVWTEQGQDYITVSFEANLLDYTVDEKNGIVVTGNKSEPAEFAEYWTFTRPVGPNSWRLTAIQQP